MAKRRCAACGDLFTARRNVPRQRYCSKGECQRARRRSWQQEKRRQDPDYRANQAAAQRHWCEANPDYWRDYRRRHPEYAARNREQQRERNRRRREAASDPPSEAVAKMDAYESQSPVQSGTYQLVPVPAESGEVAKMDAYLVRIEVISSTCGQTDDDCKEST